MKIKEALRLQLQLKMSERVAGAHCGMSHGAAGNYKRQAEQLGLTWESLAGMSESAIWALFGKQTKAEQRAEGKRAPDLYALYVEMKRPHATLTALWQEYLELDPATAFKETAFRERYVAYKRMLDVRMRFEHVAGEKLWVDYAGATLPVWHADDSAVEFAAQIFVAVMGVGSYTFAEATRSQTRPDFFGSLDRCFRFMGAVPHIIVPDNLAAAVDRADRNAPVINRGMLDFASHYGSIVLPAHAGKPRHKAKVENGVRLVERWILFALRNRRFHSLDELNAAIAELVARLNDRKLRNLPATRRELFEKLDRPAMLAYRAGYVYGDWAQAKINPQYCARVAGKYYSVPFQYVGKHVWARVSTFTVEVYYDDERIAVHDRILAAEKVYAVKPEHMPPNHAAMVQESAEKLYAWARHVGSGALAYIDAFLTVRRGSHTAHGPAKGILTLARTYGNARVDAACLRALELKLFDAKSVERILRHGRDQKSPEQKELALPQGHRNIRGADYYH
jgi:transposase